MNNRFDSPRCRAVAAGELAKGLASSVPRRQALKKFRVDLAGMALACLLGFSTRAQVALGPPIELSFPNPLGGCDDGLRPGGTWTLQDAAEPFVAVNPVNSQNVVAMWMGGFVQNVIVGVSFDGGASWQLVPLPVTLCAGGPYLGGGDPWLSFAPNGDLFASGVMGNSFSATLLGVCKSTDGGLHWSAPAFVASSNTPDKPTITADPGDPRFVYATWSQGSPSKAQFARSTDGGLTWGTPQSVSSTQPAGSCQVLVLPDGTLLELYVRNSKNILQGVRSTDRGQTWSNPTDLIAMTPIAVFDPEQGQPIRAGAGIPSYAIDRQSGNLYVVWADGRFSNFLYDDIAFSMSADSGFTWSPPIRINQTPLNIAPANRQAFLPIIAVASNGTIGVSYYDFRFNNPNPGLLTDCWLVKCQPSATTPPTNPANWGEVRLTVNSFDLEAALSWNGLFVGDYEGLAAHGNGFVSVFGAVDQNGVTSIFARRIGP